MMADIISTWEVVSIKNKGIEVEENWLGKQFLKAGFMAGVYFKMIFIGIGIFIYHYTHWICLLPFMALQFYVVIKNNEAYKKAKRRSL